MPWPKATTEWTFNKGRDRKNDQDVTILLTGGDAVWREINMRTHQDESLAGVANLGVFRTVTVGERSKCGGH